MPRTFRILLVLPILAAAALTWFVLPAAPSAPGADLAWRARPLPPSARLGDTLWPFRLERIWTLAGDPGFVGGFSSMLWQGGDRFLAISDEGVMVEMAIGRRAPPLRVDRYLDPDSALRSQKWSRDIESATTDPGGRHLWIGLETSNSIRRLAPDRSVERVAKPAAMAGWPINVGAESLARLPDGRFLVLCECDSGIAADGSHPAVLFAGDPTEKPDEAIRFTLAGPPGFRPVDAAALPDGRVLVLLRRMVWPLPLRTAARIAIGDPRQIRANGTWPVRVVARIPSSLPVDNFEGMALVPGSPRAPGDEGTIGVWLISDDNFARGQRTVVWQMALDPARLPARSAAPR